MLLKRQRRARRGRLLGRGLGRGGLAGAARRGGGHACIWHGWRAVTRTIDAMRCATSRRVALARKLLASGAHRTARAMMYHAYQAHTDLMWPLRTLSAAPSLPVLERRRAPAPAGACARLAAACEVLALGRAHARAAGLAASTASRSTASRVPVTEEVGRVDAVRHPAALPQGRRRRAAARAGRRADVGPLRHAAARHRAHAAAPTTTSTSPTGTTRATCRCAPAASASTSTSST